MVRIEHEQAVQRRARGGPGDHEQSEVAREDEHLDRGRWWWRAIRLSGRADQVGSDTCLAFKCEQYAPEVLSTWEVRLARQHLTIEWQFSVLLA